MKPVGGHSPRLMPDKSIQRHATGAGFKYRARPKIPEAQTGKIAAFIPEGQPLIYRA
jgi:hypothetical protein